MLFMYVWTSSYMYQNHSKAGGITQTAQAAQALACALLCEKVIGIASSLTQVSQNNEQCLKNNN